MQGHTVNLFHLASSWQCAAEIEVSIVFGNPRIELYEYDTGDPADCYCDFDLRFDFEVPDPGSYLLEVWKETGPATFVLMAEIPIQIEGLFAGREGVEVDQSLCGGWPTAVPEAGLLSLDFSTLKSRYQLSFFGSQAVPFRRQTRSGPAAKRKPRPGFQASKYSKHNDLRFSRENRNNWHLPCNKPSASRGN